MAKHVGYEPCPKCISKGRDRSGDNLGRYSDGSGHCFSCGHHEFPTFATKKREVPKDDKEKYVLPADFSREVPAKAWKWLLQYGLPYSYWKPFVGYSEEHSRLVLTFGNPVKFSIGRAMQPDKRKWRFWGDGHEYVEILSPEKKGPVVLVEDLISAHKVAQVSPCLCLFGTHIHDNALKVLMDAKRPVCLWLDSDQYPLLSKKIGRLKAVLRHPVWYVRTDKDPKEYSLEEIKEFIK